MATMEKRSLETEMHEVITSGKVPIFEIPVIDLENNEPDHVICEIEILPDVVRCSRVGITENELKSQKITYTKIERDDDFSLDIHLQELYGKVIEEIINSELYNLYEEN